MTVNSDIGCSYISEQWRKTISLGAYKLKLVMTLSELLRQLVLHNKSTEAILIYGLSLVIFVEPKSVSFSVPTILPCQRISQ